LLPDRPPVPSASLHADLTEAVAGADVVMMLRVQRERMDRAGWPDRDAYYADWGLQQSHLERAAPDCVVMHPGPINRGMEIATEVADGERSLILEQVKMGVFTRVAIFEWLFD
jgi:aspartate carbamoyltransferase catalytic subunit